MQPLTRTPRCVARALRCVRGWHRSECERLAWSPNSNVKQHRWHACISLSLTPLFLQRCSVVQLFSARSEAEINNCRKAKNGGRFLCVKRDTLPLPPAINQSKVCRPKCTLHTSLDYMNQHASFSYNKPWIVHEPIRLILSYNEQTTDYFYRFPIS